jgi:hypothetical protein
MWLSRLPRIVARNYKKAFSVVLLVLVDVHCNFIAADSGPYEKKKTAMEEFWSILTWKHTWKWDIKHTINA